MKYRNCVVIFKMKAKKEVLSVVLLEYFDSVDKILKGIVTIEMSYTSGRTFLWNCFKHLSLWIKYPKYVTNQMKTTKACYTAVLF